jgi:hypothetical protein
MSNRERKRWTIGIIAGAVLVALAFIFFGGEAGQPVVQDQTNDEMEVAPS